MKDKVMKHLLLELEANEKGAGKWAAKVYVLMDNTKHHLKDEEDIPFSKCVTVLSQEEAEEIGREIQVFKNGQSRPHPEAEIVPPEGSNEKKQ
jgi:hypothetical protein